ncbi:MAG: hypothetical protein U0992_06695 [Planctomycetaceae bacterium]
MPATGRLFAGRRQTPARKAGGDNPVAELPTTRLAGTYEARYAPDQHRREYFVAQSDRAESDLTPLDPAQVRSLGTEHGVRFVPRQRDYEQATCAEPNWFQP